MARDLRAQAPSRRPQDGGSSQLQKAADIDLVIKRLTCFTSVKNRTREAMRDLINAFVKPSFMAHVLRTVSERRTLDDFEEGKCEQTFST